jgi:hypothetical protein
MYAYYIYDYVVSEYDAYVEYLKGIGFVYRDYQPFDDGTSYFYVNEQNGTLVEMFIPTNNEDFLIQVTFDY